MKQAINIFAVLLFVMFSLSDCFGQTYTAVGAATTPILVELFTSEGCSSCPPADSFLQQLDASQPVRGARLIVLSEHVDYFNHDGWTDPYSSSYVTDRQNAYIHALDLPNPYTPQIIVDGTEVLQLDHPKKVGQVFQNLATEPTIPIHLNTVVKNSNEPRALSANIQIIGDSNKHSAEIYLAVALDHATSHVLHGENGGQTLTHVAILQSLTKVGKLSKGHSFSKDVPVKLSPGTDPKMIRIIVFLQESGPGRVLGAAMTRIVP